MFKKIFLSFVAMACLLAGCSQFICTCKVPGRTRKSEQISLQPARPGRSPGPDQNHLRWSVRIHHHIDFDWKFNKADIENAKNIDFDDRKWSTVNLPHDWMIEGPIDKDNPSGTAGGFSPGGIGWYRKYLRLPQEHKGKKVYLHFDGIYRNSDVWVNGQHIGHRTYGYISHYYDITPYVTYDAANVIAVRVDGSVQPIDRWYSGCGIYRHVWLTITDPLHVPIWGTYITTPEVNQPEGPDRIKPAFGRQATINIQTKLRNDRTGEQNYRLVTKIINPSDKEVCQISTEGAIDAGRLEVLKQQFIIPNPKLWSVEYPNLYKVVSLVYAGDQLVDNYETPFGIRKVEFNPDFGFKLNGKKLIMKGVCLHHDAGSVGAAVPDRVWERRLKILKDMGVNAVRLAHNPHAPQLLDMCDRIGLLVFDEIYDKWITPWQDSKTWSDVLIDEYKTQFEASWEQDLQDFIDRDKNHPSVVIWSVGNETREQLKEPEDAVRQLKMYIDKVHQLDPSRKVTCALHPHGETPSRMIHDMDVVSYNYRTKEMAKWHEKYPNYVWLASETKPYRKDEPRDWAKIDYSNNSWFYMSDFVAGQFIWSGIDYLGESRGWPDKGIRSGIIFTTGFRKSYSYFNESIYSEKPMVHIVALDDLLLKELISLKSNLKSWYGPPLSDHWTFPESEGRNIQVFTYTNCESVELILNRKSLGTKALADFNDRIIRWDVPYAEGTIRAVGKNRGKAVCKHELTTAGDATKVALLPDRTTLCADGKDVAHIEVRITDTKGVLVPRATNKIHFEVEGAGKIIGIDNGDMSDHSSPIGPDKEYRGGRLLVIVQADRNPGQVIVKAKAPGLRTKPLTLRVL